jgi:hypothetical protein
VSLATNLISKPTGILSNPNTKIFKISSQNSNSSPSSTISNLISSPTNSSNLNSNKIQYVKILNSSAQVQQNKVISNSTTPIKITTISANTNTNAITTTTTNSESSTSITQEENSSSTTQNKNNINNPTIPIQSESTFLIPQKELNIGDTSALFDAVTNNGQKTATPTSNALKQGLQTFQLVNTNNQTNNTIKIQTKSQNDASLQCTPPKAPVIQRIQSVSSYTNQQITGKTIINAGGSLASQIQPQTTVLNSYKVLSQQLPSQHNQAFNVKSIGSLNFKTTNNIQGTESGKQIITTVRNEINSNNQTLAKQKNPTITTISNLNAKSPFSNLNISHITTQVANPGSFNFLSLKPTSAPLNVLTNNSNNNQNAYSNQQINSPSSSVLQSDSPNRLNKTNNLENNSSSNLNTSPQSSQTT